MTALATHDAAALFPLMERARLEELAADIRAHGLHQPIVLHEGMVLDGRNRLAACEIAGVEPRLTTFGGGDPYEYVASVNLHRRHLTESQRALIGARIKEHYEAEAAQRRRDHAGTSPGNPARKTLRANLPEVKDRGRARDHAAAVVRVSPRSVEHAATVLKSGTPEEIRAVEAGEVAVSAMAAQVRARDTRPNGRKKRRRGPRIEERSVTCPHCGEVFGLAQERQS
ncbi:MAG: ParB N-terminal domain-containing protein [Patescibacteria group bacterium]